LALSQRFDFLIRLLRHAFHERKISMLKPLTISPEDASTLAGAYKKLLESRQEMIDAMKPLEDSEYRRSVVVDSIISGLTSYFNEIARNTSAHAEEIKNFASTTTPGVALTSFTQGVVDNVLSMLKKIR
jgi:hypothetical protein